MSPGKAAVFALLLTACASAPAPSALRGYALAGDGQAPKRDLRGPRIRPGRFLLDRARPFRGAETRELRALALWRGRLYLGGAAGLFSRSAKPEDEGRFDRLSEEAVTALAAGEHLLAASADAITLYDAGAPPRGLPLPPGGVACLSAEEPWLAGGPGGLFRWEGSSWRREAAVSGAVRAIARRGSIVVAATEAGLFEKSGEAGWERLRPRQGARSWAPVDVRAAFFDGAGRLWFASPQGIGRRDPDSWTLLGPEQGLPYNDFRCGAAAPDGAVVFGTGIGAIRYDGAAWEYRQSRRWLPDDRVRDVVCGPDGAWLATADGLGALYRRGITLAEKAAAYEAAITRKHSRTRFGFVTRVNLDIPGDPEHWRQRDSDNDGLWTGMYGAAQCFAYGATKEPVYRERARRAFRALSFLSEVTQRSDPKAQPGFPARSILPGNGPDPNPPGGRKTRKRDRLWKNDLSPRWPKTKDGAWFWKCDTSSDELDGHFFFYARFYDLAAEDEAEKAAVRVVVRRIIDHLVRNDFRLVDHDGKPTRWANFSPRSLNHDPDWHEERGLNSLSILSYLVTAAHITGDDTYRRIARNLVLRHGYGQNLMVPKVQQGPGTGNQSDDEMAFMGFYNLLAYAKEPEVRGAAALAFYRYWLLERYELNPFFDFCFNAVAADEVVATPWGDERLSPPKGWLADSLDTLKRFPLDRIDWTMSNSHRLDIRRLPDHASGGRDNKRGGRRDGRVLPIDERVLRAWNADPWRLDSRGGGRALHDGTAYLLPYYMGRYHGFIDED